jgi:hypothetical protein
MTISRAESPVRRLEKHYFMSSRSIGSDYSTILIFRGFPCHDIQKLPSLYLITKSVPNRSGQYLPFASTSRELISTKRHSRLQLTLTQAHKSVHKWRRTLKPAPGVLTLERSSGDSLLMSGGCDTARSTAYLTDATPAIERTRMRL